MKSFALTALAAVASAQVVNTEGPETAIPAVTYESITSTGTLGEY